jgi:mannitol-1-/sugar-/sorbitol-6-/2-deoxyglucose-6-phosphatase
MQYLRDQGFKIAIHSSSDYDLITAVMEKLQIGAYIDIVHSGQDEAYGKPHPGGYITTCQKLGLEPNQCIAFEDSLN